MFQSFWKTGVITEMRLSPEIHDSYTLHFFLFIVVYYESINRNLMTRPTNECRSDERLKTKDEESTRLGYTGLLGELQHLKTKTRLIELFIMKR
jgi:hypothetical protein